MFTLPGNVIDLTGRVLHTLFGEGQQMEGDVMDFLINQWKDKPETSEIFSCADRVVLSPYFIQVFVFVTLSPYFALVLVKWYCEVFLFVVIFEFLILLMVCL